MAEVVRNCAGGVVFWNDSVFLLKSDKGEWVMPKGVIRNQQPSNEIALWRVEDEAGIQAEITGIAGNTSYSYFSESRQKGVINRIQWFAMRALDEKYHINTDQGFLDGKYYPYQTALEILTHDSDKDVLRRAKAIDERIR